MFAVRIRRPALALVVVAQLLGAAWYVVLEKPWLAAVGAGLAVTGWILGMAAARAHQLTEVDGLTR